MTAIILSAGCTDDIYLPGSTPYITDDNITHQKWMAEFQENPEKYETNPENPLEWTVKGMASVAAGGRNEEALEYYDIAIGLDSEFALAYYGKAVALFNLQRYDEAEWCLEKAVEINPQYEPIAKRVRSSFIREKS